jgi:hypothetical protein
MEDPFQNEVYEEEYAYEPEPKKRMSGGTIALIVILVIIVLCCLCAFVVVGGLALLGPSVGNTFSTIIETLEAATPMP